MPLNFDISVTPDSNARVRDWLQYDMMQPQSKKVQAPVRRVKVHGDDKENQEPERVRSKSSKQGLAAKKATTLNSRSTVHQRRALLPISLNAAQNTKNALDLLAPTVVKQVLELSSNAVFVYATAFCDCGVFTGGEQPPKVVFQLCR